MMVREIGLRGRLDLQSFNANVQSFMKAMSGMNKEVTKVAKESVVGSKAAGDAAGTLGINWQRVKDIVTGLVVIDVFRQISSGLKSVIADAFDAAAVFQTLQITMEAVLARDYSKEFGIPVSKALQIVATEAKELLGWVREVAITTPFSVESLTSAIAFGQAFGFTVEQTKRLTLATGDFVAGMGLTNLQFSRIIYNFGQMLASGRVLGRELRDLANNLVPIRDITQMLADEAGIPFDEMKQAMSEAKISASQFISAFTQMAEKDFPGAMERLSRTMVGVKQNVSDFIRTLFGLELLGPIIERVSIIAADALDAAFSPETMRAFAIVGEVLLDTFNRIYANLVIYLIPAIKDFFSALGIGSPTVMQLASVLIIMSEAVILVIRALSTAVRKVTDFISTLSEKFGTTFADVIKNAAGWGSGIIQALAEGMAKAVIYIIQVLNAIARIFTYWLHTSSAPKLLPDLAKWGKGAMEAWLEGWTSADFGLFRDITSVVSSFIRSIAHTIPEANLIPRIIGARGAIEKAVNEIKKFGTITASTMKRIVNSVGSASEAMHNFVRETFEFAQISGIVKAAKKLLDFDIEFNVPTKILGQTVSSLKDLGRLARRFKGTLGDALRGYVDALGDAAEANKRVAKEQQNLNAITDKYNKALNKLSILQDQLRKKQDFTGRVKQIEAALATGLLTDEEKRRLELEKEEIILTHKIAALENERDVAVDSAKARLDAEQAIADEAEDRLSRQRGLATLLADEQLAAAKEQLDAARALIDMQIEHNNLIQEQVKLLERLAARAAGEAEGEFMDLPGMEFEGITDAFESSLEGSKKAIAQAINDLRADIRTRIEEFIADITAPFEGVHERLSQLLTDIGTVFTTAAQDPAIQQFGTSLRNFADNVLVSLTNLRTFWEENGPGILKIVGEFFGGLSIALKPELQGLLINLGLSIEGFGKSIVTATEDLVEKGPQIQESIQGWIDWIVEEGIPKLQDFGKTLKEDIVPAFQTMVRTVVDNAPAIIAVLAALGSAFLSLRPALIVLSVLAKVGLALIPLQIIFNTFSGTVGTLAKAFGGLGGFLAPLGPILASIGAFIAANLAPILVVFLAVGAVVLVVAENFEAFKKLAISTFDAIKKAIAPAIKPLLKAFKDLKPAFDTLMKSLKPVGTFLLGVLKVIGYVILGVLVPALLVVIGVVIGVIRGIVEAFTGFLNAIQTVWYGLSKIVEGIVKIFTGLWDIIVGLFTGNAEKISEGFETLVSGIGDILVGLIVAIIGNIEMIFNLIVGLVGGFINGIIDFFVSLYDSLIGKSIIPDMLKDILSAFTTFFTDTIKRFSEWVSGIVTSIVEKYTEVKEAGTEFLQNLIDGIKEKVFGEDGLIAKVGQWISDTIEKAREHLSDFLTAGKDFIIELIEGIRQKFEGALGLWAKFKQWILDTLDAIVEIKDDLIQAGIDIVAGLIEGLWQKATDLYDTVANIIKNALGIAEEESEAESESKRMRRLGEDWMTGLAKGISEGATGVENAMSVVFSDLLSIPEDMQLDLSNITAELGSLENLGGNLDVRHLLQPTGGASTSLTQPSPSQTTIQNLNVEVNAAYSEVQSEASIYYDVQAALAHITR